MSGVIFGDVPVCRLCRRRIEDHRIVHGPLTPEQERTLVEGEFDIPTSGFYCPIEAA